MAFSNSNEIALNKGLGKWINNQTEITSPGEVENFEDIKIDYERIETLSGEKNYSVRNPNKITIETFQNTDKGIDVIICKDEKDFFTMSHNYY